MRIQAPDGSIYEWSKPTPPTQADWEALRRLHESRKAQGQPKAKPQTQQPQPKAVPNADPTGAKMRGLLGIGEPPKPDPGGSLYDQALKDAAEKRKQSDGKGLGAMLRAARTERTDYEKALKARKQEQTERIATHKYDREMAALNNAAMQDQSLIRSLTPTGNQGEAVQHLRTFGDPIIDQSAMRERFRPPGYRKEDWTPDSTPGAALLNALQAIGLPRVAYQGIGRGVLRNTVGDAAATNVSAGFAEGVGIAAHVLAGVGSSIATKGPGLVLDATDLIAEAFTGARAASSAKAIGKVALRETVDQLEAKMAQQLASKSEKVRAGAADTMRAIAKAKAELQDPTVPGIDPATRGELETKFRAMGMNPEQAKGAANAAEAWGHLTGKDPTEAVNQAFAKIGAKGWTPKSPDVLPGVEFRPRAQESAPPAGAVETPPRRAQTGVTTGKVSVWHGSAVELDTPPSVRSAVETPGVVFFTDDATVAEAFRYPRAYGEIDWDAAPGTLVRADIELKNPLVLEETDAQRFTDDSSYQLEVVSKAKRDGHDGIIALGVREGVGMDVFDPANTYVVFDDRSIKVVDGLSTNAKSPAKGTGGWAQLPPSAKPDPLQELLDETAEIERNLASGVYPPEKVPFFEKWLADNKAEIQQMRATETPTPAQPAAQAPAPVQPQPKLSNMTDLSGSGLAQKMGVTDLNKDGVVDVLGLTLGGGFAGMLGQSGSKLGRGVAAALDPIGEGAWPLLKGAAPKIAKALQAKFPGQGLIEGGEGAARRMAAAETGTPFRTEQADRSVPIAPVSQDLPNIADAGRRPKQEPPTVSGNPQAVALTDDEYNAASQAESVWRDAKSERGTIGRELDAARKRLKAAESRHERRVRDGLALDDRFANAKAEVDELEARQAEADRSEAVARAEFERFDRNAYREATLERQRAANAPSVERLKRERKLLDDAKKRIGKQETEPDGYQNRDAYDDPEALARFELYDEHLESVAQSRFDKAVNELRDRYPNGVDSLSERIAIARADVGSYGDAPEQYVQDTYRSLVRRAQAVDNTANAADALKDEGWEFDMSNLSDSVYFMKGDVKVRISDHDLPSYHKSNNFGYLVKEVDWSDLEDGSVDDVLQAVRRHDPTPRAAQTPAQQAAPVQTPKTPEPAPAGSTAAKNAVTDEQRQRFGLGDLPEAERVTAEEMIQGANKVYSGDEAARVRAKVDAGEAVNSTEQGVLLLHREALGKRIADGDKSDALLKEFDETTLALKRGGSETARTLAFRRFENEMDMDALTIRSKYVEALDRPLTKGESAEAEALAGRYEDLTKRIEELTARAEKAEADLDAARTVSEMSKRRAKAPNVERIRERRSEAVSRLKEKWAARAAEKEDGTVDVASGFTPEEFKKALLLDIAPEIIEIAKSIVDEGVAQAAEVAKRTAALLKAQGVDIDEADVKAVIGGKVRAKREEAKKAVSDWQKVKGEVSAEFRAEREANLAEQRRVKAELAEADRAAKAEKKRELDKLRAEEQWRRMVEKEWNADVARREAAWRRGERAKEAAANRKERKEYTDWWKQSEGGKRAKLLNDIDRLQDKLVDLEAGNLPASRLREEVPPEVQDLWFKREALRVEARKRVEHLKIKAQKEGRSAPEKVSDVLLDVAGVPRTLLATGDVSAPFNQGAFAMVSNPKQWASAWTPTLQVIKKEGYERFIGEIRGHRMHDRARVAGLELSALDLSPGEDMFVSETIKKVPGFGHLVKFSEREYAAFLTKLRIEMFDEMVTSAQKIGPALTKDQLRETARFVNTVTGRGQGAIAKIAGSAKLGNVFFAPSYWASLWETAALVPLRKSVANAARTGDWRVAKQIGRRYAYAYATVLGTMGAASIGLGAAGFTVHTDWRDKDFGRATRKRGRETQAFDVMPPQMRQFYSVMGRLIGGTMNEKGKVQRGFYDRGGVWGSLIEGKAAPSIKTGLAISDGKAFGKSYDVRTPEGAGNVAKGSLLPISAQQVEEVWNSKKLTPAEKAFFIAILGPLGRAPNIREKN